MLHSICEQIWKTRQWPQDWKKSVFIPIPKNGNAKQHSNYRTIALISHASKVMPKILQVRLQQYMNWELPDVHVRFRKGRETRDQIGNIHWILKKHRELWKNIYFCWVGYTKAQTGKIFKRLEHHTTLPASREICMQVKKQQLKPNMEQQTVSKLGKEYVKAQCCHPFI